MLFRSPSELPHEFVPHRDLEWAFKTGRRPSDDEITMWNEFMRKFGWRDHAAEMLARRKREARMEDRDEIETMFQFIDADEGRLSPSS